MKRGLTILHSPYRAVHTAVADVGRANRDLYVPS
jgi:hypothetical protein